METVRVAQVKLNLNKNFNLCSKLWQYQNKEASNNAIPCLYFQANTNNNKIMVYFHGNG